MAFQQFQGAPPGASADGMVEMVEKKEDRFLPIANIARIMKKALPNSAKVAKDTKESMQECVSEFISFITSEASDRCLQEKRKTVNGEDLLWAMGSLGFESYIEPLRAYLLRFREAQRLEKPPRKNSKKARLAAEAAAAAEQAQHQQQQQQHQQAQFQYYQHQQHQQQQHADDEEEDEEEEEYDE